MFIDGEEDQAHLGSTYVWSAVMAVVSRAANCSSWAVFVKQVVSKMQNAMVDNVKPLLASLRRTMKEEKAKVHFLFLWTDAELGRKQGLTLYAQSPSSVLKEDN